MLKDFSQLTPGLKRAVHGSTYPLCLHSVNFMADELFEGVISRGGGVDSTNFRPSTNGDGGSRPRKQRRTSRACDFCHNRSIRCRQIPGEGRCQNCTDFDVTCNYNRPAKKRGIQSRQHVSTAQGFASGEEAHLLLQMSSGSVNGYRQPALAASASDPSSVDSERDHSGNITFPLATEHRDLALGETKMIADLVNVYFEVVYPIFPLFHQQTLLHNVARREYLSNQPAFSDIMSICALASARARDGAVFSGRWPTSYFQQASTEAFFSAAKDAMPRDLSAMRGLQGMRTCIILALYGIQVGKIDIMHQYLGMYHSFIAMDGLHNEMNWPKNIGIVEVEERRRLFWSTYTLEVYSSIVWGGVIRCREAQSRVFYPSEVDDNLFSDDGYVETASKSSTEQHSSSMNLPIVSPSSWLHGWNFTTELYRILEHAMDDFHRRRPQQAGLFSPSELFSRDAPSQSIILEKVMSMYNELPPKLKKTNSVVSGMAEDIFGFQAANITATLQLVRMVLFTAEDATVDQKCSIAHEFLDGFSQVPVHFLRAISSPLLFHLAGIGSILGSVIEGPLSELSYHQVREVLLGMADLLGSLEIGITRNVGAAGRLRSQITRMDEYMVAQRQMEKPQDTYRYASERADKSVGTLPPSSAGPDTGPQTAQWQNQLLEPYEYAGDVIGNSEIGSDQPLIHLPPELLEGWPWYSDFPQTFNLFD